MNDPVLTAKEAAKRLGVGEVTIQRYMRSGKLKGYRLATKSGWRVYASSVDDYIRRHGNEPTATDATQPEAKK